MSENKTDLSQSFCGYAPTEWDKDGCPGRNDDGSCPDGSCTTRCGAKVTFNTEQGSDLSEPDSSDECNEEKCPGGVCPMPKKRKMRPPSDAMSGPPGMPAFDQLFSQLFSSVLNPDKGDTDEAPPNPVDKWADILKSSMNGVVDRENEYTDDEGDEGDDVDDEDDDEGDEDDGVDIRWDTLNNLTRSFLELLRDDKE